MRTKAFESQINEQTEINQEDCNQKGDNRTDQSLQQVNPAA